MTDPFLALGRRAEGAARATPPQLAPTGRVADARPVGMEIERKFVVADTTVTTGVAGIRYRQAYLSTDPDRTVRVRIAGERALLTIKGRSIGPSRPEFEYPIPPEDAAALLSLCVGNPVEKTRHRIGYAGHTWEVDVFTGANAGLVLAEVELPSPETPVEVPGWAGAEVTDDHRYANAYLAEHPYAGWARDP